MPTYEYRCNACGKEFEYQQRMSDPDLTKCEACNEDKLEKLISRTAFQLKGSGWYKDLYSSSKPDAGAKDTTTPAAATSGDSGGGASAGTSSAGDSGSSGSSSTSSTPAAPAATPSKPSSTP